MVFWPSIVLVLAIVYESIVNNPASPFSPAMGLGSAVSSPNGIQGGAQAAIMFSYILKRHVASPGTCRVPISGAMAPLAPLNSPLLPFAGLLD